MIQSHNIKEILEQLISYYNSTRGVGHTYLMLKGLESQDRKTNLLIHSPEPGDHIKRTMMQNPDLLKVITPVTIDKLKGTKLPLVIEHYVLSQILYSALSKIRKLESIIDRISDNA